MRGAAAGWAALVLGALACVGGTARRPASMTHVAPAGVVAVRWQLPLHPRGRGGGHREECASGVVAGNTLVLGTRARKVHGIDLDAAQLRWTTDVTGSVDSPATWDSERRQVLIGADDGSLWAVDPQSGNARWTAKTKGAIERGALVSGGRVFVATAADRLAAFDAASGKFLWEYGRDTPDDFTIRGHAAPRLVGSSLLGGFSDGFLVALAPATGELQWPRSLAAASEQFVDVDATPLEVAGTLFASSYSGGLHALDPADGSVRWRKPIEGVGTMRFDAGRLYFSAGAAGVFAMDLSGNVLWQQAMGDAGELSTPLVVGSHLFVTGSRAGLFVIDRATGRLLQTFDRGEGACAEPTWDPDRQRIYLLVNGGILYALDVYG